MAKVSENIVLFSKADPTVQVFADKVVTEVDGVKKKSIVLKDATGKEYKLDDCIRPSLRDIEGIKKFLGGFNSLPCNPRSGYDSFVSGEGPTNPKTPTKFSPDGTFRIILVYLQALHMKVAEGGQKGEDAAALLKMLPLYNAVAADTVSVALEKRKEAKVAETAKDLDVDPAELAAFLAARRAKRAGTVPAADVSDEDGTGESDEDSDDDTLVIDAEGESSDEPTADIEETV
jgi:hypothetical protein